MKTNIGERLSRLERSLAGHGRQIVCEVRDGHTEEDVARAFADAGLTRTKDDLVVALRRFSFDGEPECVPRVLSVRPGA